MGSKEFKIAAVLGLLLSLMGCATVNYSYKNNPCDNVLETENEIVLKCPKYFNLKPVIPHEPRERR